MRPPLRKALGQHHLADGALCRPLVEFLGPAGERVVEVGPGGGVLTAELLTADARRVLAWELDLAWGAELQRRLGRNEAGVDDRIGGGRLSIVLGDALDIPWRRLPSPTLVAGNLPYGLSTRLIRDLLPAWERVPRAAFLVQLEVAERLVAGPGDPAYGALSVLVGAYAEARLLGRVKRGSFRPPPKVDGGFVGLRLRRPPLPEEDMADLVETVHLAFGRRRKTLANALAAGWGRQEARRRVAAAGLDPRLRAEQLGLEELLKLHATQ